MVSPRRFEGMVAIVTGAGAGIGRAIATKLAAEGAAITLVDSNATALDEVAEQLRSDGVRCRCELVNLSDSRQYEGLVTRTSSTWGRLDILVNNAADVGRRLSLDALTHEEWSRVLDTNLTAPLFLSRDAARAMAAAGYGGAIINVSSIQVHLPLATQVPYVSSKGGLEAMTRAMAVELGPLGIRVNAVAPGVIATPGMQAERDEVGAMVDVGEEATLSGRSGTADDVAAAVLFLASHEAAHITAATLTVDGGRRVSRKLDPLAEGVARGPKQAGDWR